VVFVGIDLFTYAPVFDHIRKLRNEVGFKWICIAPYDLPTIRNDYIKLFSIPDQVYVYSKFAENLLSYEETLDVKYFRPPLYNADTYQVPSPDEKNELRKIVFGSQFGLDTTLFMFVGANQRRKNIPRMLKGFATFLTNEIKQGNDPNCAFYIHMNINRGVYNIKQIINDYPILRKYIYYNQKENHVSLPQEMPKLYQCADVYVNVSHHEGLSWTPIEAMLCGVPCILSDSTAHLDFNNNPGIYFVEQADLGFVLQFSSYGECLLECAACNHESIADALSDMYCMHQEDHAVYKTMSNECKKFANKWVQEVHNINDILTNDNSINLGIGDLI
jgi:glycosyltransferase involved in cell wall biosynthesis